MAAQQRAQLALLGELCGLAIACAQPRELELKMKPNLGIKSSAKSGGDIFIYRYLMEYFASLDDQHL